MYITTYLQYRGRLFYTGMAFQECLMIYFTHYVYCFFNMDKLEFTGNKECGTHLFILLIFFILELVVLNNVNGIINVAY